MSFSSTVKKELSGANSGARHCQIAGLAAIMSCVGTIQSDQQGKNAVYINTENGEALRKLFTLLDKTIIVNGTVRALLEEGVENGRFSGELPLSETEMSELLSMIKWVGNTTPKEEYCLVSEVLLKKSCCQRAYLADTFLCIGSMSDPKKEYHLEFVCQEQTQAAQIIDILSLQGIEAKSIARKKYEVVYVKDSTGIIDLLSLMGAHVSLMDMENSRILKEIANSVNRRVNCETANIEKTVNAAQKQVEDIQLIKKENRWKSLSAPLQEIAEQRLAYPDATLKELGLLLTPQVGKSGVNHRLRKISEMADQLRTSGS